MSWTSLFDNAASLAIAGGAVATGIGWSGRKIWKGIGRLRRFLDDYEGTPARKGVEPRPGVMERLQTGESQNTLILDRLEAGDRRFDAIDGRLDGFDERLQAVVDELPKNGMPAAEKLDYVYQWIRSQAETGPTP